MFAVVVPLTRQGPDAGNTNMSFLDTSSSTRSFEPDKPKPATSLNFSSFVTKLKRSSAFKLGHSSRHLMGESKRPSKLSASRSRLFSNDPDSHLQSLLTPETAPFLSCRLDQRIPTQEYRRQDLNVPMNKILQDGDFFQVLEAGFPGPKRTRKEHPYQIKFLHRSIFRHADKDESVLERAATKMMVEALYLAHLSHPHIVKLRGANAGGLGALQHDQPEALFFLTDRMGETLTQRLESWKQWATAKAAEEVKREKRILQRAKNRPKRANATDPGFSSSAPILKDKQIRTYPDDLLILKTNYALQILHALEHLHERGIVIRELRPDGIAFCDFPNHHHLQLVDLSCCKEIPLGKTHISPKGDFRLRPRSGARNVITICSDVSERKVNDPSMLEEGIEVQQTMTENVPHMATAESQQLQHMLRSPLIETEPINEPFRESIIINAQDAFPTSEEKCDSQSSLLDSAQAQAAADTSEPSPQPMTVAFVPPNERVDSHPLATVSESKETQSAEDDGGRQRNSMDCFSLTSDDSAYQPCRDSRVLHPGREKNEPGHPLEDTSTVSSAIPLHDGVLGVRTTVTARRYMAPELFGGIGNGQSQQGYNTQADLYSFAMIFAEMLTEKKPYGTKQLSRDWKKIVEGTLRPTIVKHPFPRTVKAGLEQAWHARPEKRGTAAQLSQSMDRVLRMLECGHQLMGTTLKSEAPPPNPLVDLLPPNEAEIQEPTLPERAAKYKRWMLKQPQGWSNVWDPRVGVKKSVSMDEEVQAECQAIKEDVFKRRTKESANKRC